MLDDFICERQSEEYASYMYDYEMHDTWYQVEQNFCEEMGIEPECYDD